MPGSRRRRMLRFAAGWLVAASMLSACAGDDEPSGTVPPTDDGPLVVEVVIENLQVSPTINRVPVDIGDEVSLKVTSDADDTIHVHGVERELVLTAGEQGTLDFTIPTGLPRGLYDVEAHDGGLILFELRVR